MTLQRGECERRDRKKDQEPRRDMFLDSCGATSGIVGEQERSLSRSCD
jgi:hypothetical protein